MCAHALAVSSPRPTITPVYQAHHRFAGHGLVQPRPFHDPTGRSVLPVDKMSGRPPAGM